MNQTRKLIELNETNIRQQLEVLDHNIRILTSSKRDAHRRRKQTKTILIVFSLLVGILGVILTTLSAINTDDNFLNTLTTILSISSGLLGFIITFITNQFGPDTFKQRTIELGQLIYDLNKIGEKFNYELHKCLLSESNDKLHQLEQLYKRLHEELKDPIERSRELKTSIDWTDKVRPNK